MRITRRGVLVGAGVSTAGVLGGVAGIAGGVLPGRSVLYGRLGLDGRDGVVPDGAAGPRESGEIVSAARGGRRCGWTLALPPEPGGPGGSDGRGLPVVVVLHGRGADHTAAFAEDYLGLDRFLAAAVADGVAPFALVSVDGGEAYWHARADGDDLAAMVLEELLPLLAARGLDTDRLGFLGWSMGGFGALHLGALVGSGRVRAVAAVSPALWHDHADTPAGAFDGPEDFAAVTVLGRQDDLDGIAVRVDCGLGDPFCAASQDYVDGFADRPDGGFERGDHDRGYWRRIAPRQLAFLGRHL
ncbi:alpha/beta hydrolase-fold protein [Nocardioides zeae]|uniref:Alpha/beta hydrolase-fold protein n=1 Tax=Nocardioides imazamoxiresistens TaxID=3231893 RepID=A0ABU3PZS3_9ACTN|nr:alpha/beta hydrolase-fold protein [Nocardioides zeae]MDT9594644.1 alpha/beta hydrolase-fold protein [Nocardioides zeae]